jgi:peptidylprolyl isomerase
LKIVLILAAAVLVGSPALAAAPQPSAGDWRDVDAMHTLVIDTNKGRVVVELYPDVAPASVARVETLARRGFYDGLTFFRVIDGFMAQTGDPMNNGQGGSDLPNLKAEFTFRLTPGPSTPVIAHSPSGAGDALFVGVLPVVSQPAAMATLMADGKVTASVLYCQGIVGMARTDDPDTGNSQFYLMRGPKMELNARYTAVGRIVAGQAVVDSIKTGEPVDPPLDRMTKVQMLADMPAAGRPKIRVIDTRSAYFANLAAATKADKGDAFSPCDVEIAGKVN